MRGSERGLVKRGKELDCSVTAVGNHRRVLGSVGSGLCIKTTTPRCGRRKRRSREESGSAVTREGRDGGLTQ